MKRRVSEIWIDLFENDNKFLRFTGAEGTGFKSIGEGNKRRVKIMLDHPFSAFNFLHGLKLNPDTFIESFVPEETTAAHQPGEFMLHGGEAEQSLRIIRSSRVFHGVHNLKFFQFFDQTVDQFHHIFTSLLECISGALRYSAENNADANAKNFFYKQPSPGEKVFNAPDTLSSGAVFSTFSQLLSLFMEFFDHLSSYCCRVDSFRYPCLNHRERKAETAMESISYNVLLCNRDSDSLLGRVLER